MEKTTIKQTLAAVIGLSLAGLVGCGNSSSAIEGLNKQTGQAIDGYIVGGNVYCDGVSNGQTEAAGMFECPEDTNIVSVRGGSDVGFDETATSGGTPFDGELKAPGGSPYVTPLSTIATSMASTNGSFDASNYEAAVANLAVSLNIPNLDLATNPAENLEIAKVNAQINQLISNFSDSVEDYASVTEQLSQVLATQTPFDLTNDTATIVSALNEQLVVAAPDLALSSQRQIDAAKELQLINSAIEKSANIGQIDIAVDVGNATSNHAFAIDRTAPLVRFKSANYQQQEAYDSQFANYNYYANHFSLNDFQNSTLFPSGYLVDSSFNAQWVEFATNGFKIKKTLDNETVNVALEFQSMMPLDNRKMSVTMSGAKLTMKAGDSKSIKVTVPTGTIIHARAVDQFGVITNVTTDAAQDYFATNEDGNFEFSIAKLEDDLTDQGYYNFTRESGNYRLTLIINGITFGVNSGTDVETSATQYTITTANESITGNGLQGYFTTR